VIRWLAVALWIACALAGGARAQADVFHLANGGTVRGEVVNKIEEPRVSYVVKTAAGGQITLTT